LAIPVFRMQAGLIVIPLPMLVHGRAQAVSLLTFIDDRNRKPLLFLEFVVWFN